MLSSNDIRIDGVKIDDAIKQSIANAVSRLGSQSAVARQIGAAVSVIGQYMGTIKGRPTKTIPHAKYERLYPLIRAWLPSNDARYLPLSKRGISITVGQGETIIAPFAGRPVELLRLCEHWNEIPEESREMLLATIRVAIKKCRSANSA